MSLNNALGDTIGQRRPRGSFLSVTHLQVRKWSEHGLRNATNRVHGTVITVRVLVQTLHTSSLRPMPSSENTNITQEQ